MIEASPSDFNFSMGCVLGYTKWIDSNDIDNRTGDRYLRGEYLRDHSLKQGLHAQSEVGVPC